MEITEVEITDEAFGLIVQAAREAKAQDRELGGSLLAHEQDGRVLIAYAVPTGPSADRGPGHILTDAAFQNEAMRKIRLKLPVLRYIGDWHIHPMYLPDLSGRDRETARLILHDPDMGRKYLILLLATAPPGGAPVVLGFVARLSQRGSVVIGKLPITRVARDSAAVISRLGHPLLSLEQVLQADDVLISTPAQQAIDAFEDRATARIIEDDLAEIRASLGADASLWKDDELFAAQIRRGDREAFVVFPPEYPLGAPQVFAGAPDEGPLAPIALRFGWSTLHRLADPVSEALAARTGNNGGARKATARTRRRMHALRNLLAWLGLGRVASPITAECSEGAT